ncbi:MAG: cytochrome c oxidase assembly protein, partial [Solirubrobacteraceae bacterium]
MVASATPGLWDWSLDPPLVLVAGLALLYRLGSRRTVTPARTAAAQRWRNVSFYAAMAVLAIALASPLEKLSDQLFWAHMVQHVLLMLVAAPLVVIARPWVRLWRSLPLDLRRRAARAFMQGERGAQLRALARLAGTPAFGLTGFSAVLLLWHLPPLFDSTLENATLHALEHTLFFATAVLLFKQVIASPS